MITYDIIKAALDEKVFTPPHFVFSELNRLVVTGSHSYGTNTDKSDYDLVGFCTKTKDYEYPQVIYGYDDISIFEQYQQHHVTYKEYKFDITIYNITKFVKLAEKNNPNILDILFSDKVVYSDKVGDYLYSKRHEFLSKDIYPRFMGFIKNHYNDIVKVKTQQGRGEIIEKHGYDTKAACHTIRCLLEGIQILEERNLVLDKNSTILKRIRNGYHNFDDFIHFYSIMSKKLNEVKEQSVLREIPCHNRIREILLDCLNKHQNRGMVCNYD